jgi:hypothetical protein
MGNPIVTKLGRLAVLGVGFIVMVGCGPTQHAPREVPPGFGQIEKVGGLYLRYTSKSRDRAGPANLEDLKKFANGLKDDDLQELGLSKGDLATLFVSPRDQQPYGIVPKVRPLGAEAGGGPPGRGGPMRGGPPQGAGPPAGAGGSSVSPKGIVYEQVGEGGKRFVVLNSGIVVDVDDAGFQSFVPDGGK